MADPERQAKLCTRLKEAWEEKAKDDPGQRAVEEGDSEEDGRDKLKAQTRDVTKAGRFGQPNLAVRF